MSTLSELYTNRVMVNGSQVGINYDTLSRAVWNAKELVRKHKAEVPEVEIQVRNGSGNWEASAKAHADLERQVSLLKSSDYVEVKSKSQQVQASTLQSALAFLSSTAKELSKRGTLTDAEVDFLRKAIAGVNEQLPQLQKSTKK